MTAHDGEAPSVPAGWYGDPLARGRDRYWDGTQWTDDVRRAEPAPLPDLPARAEEPIPQPATPAHQQWPDTRTAAGHQPATAQPQWQAGGALPRQQPWQGVTAAAPSGRSATLADFWRRLGGTTIDAIICNLLGILVTFPVLSGIFRRSWDFSLQHPNATLDEQMAASSQIANPRDALLMFLGWTVASILYGTVMLAWRGATVGQALLRMRVVPRGDLDHTGGISLAAAFLRSLVWSIAAQWPFQLPLAVVLLFCALPVLTTPDRQGLHDRLARTQVVLRPLPMPTPGFH